MAKASQMGNLRLTRARSARLRQTLARPGLPDAPTATRPPDAGQALRLAARRVNGDRPQDTNGHRPAPAAPRRPFLCLGNLDPPEDSRQTMAAASPFQAAEANAPPAILRPPHRSALTRLRAGRSGWQLASPGGTARSRYTTGTREKSPASAAWRAARSIKGCPNGGLPRLGSLPLRR